MSYTIKKSDGTTLATVPENDIVLDAASVALIGRGATNYGAAHSEAFVHILENFAATTAPAHPLDGQLWFDKTVNALKVYNAGNWNLIGGGGGSGGGGGGGSGDNVGGPIYVIIEDQDTGVLVFVAGGKIVCVISSKNIPQTSIPVSITVLNVEIPFRSRFPFGIEAGTSMANDADDYIYYGHVPNADASLWAGGGNPFAATTFVDLGPNSVALSISNGVIIAAYSQAVVTNAALPTNFTINNITMPFRAAFPSGLRKGLTLADGMSLGIGAGTIGGDGGVGGGGVTIEVVAEMIGEETEARATAISEIYAYANDQFAQAGLVNTLNATFLSSTGQASLAQAIEWLVATAGSGTANADYAVQLKAEVTDAITGATSFANALQILNTAATTEWASASDLTTLQSTITNGYTTAISTAVQNLVTSAGLTSALASFKTELETEFEADTGYTSIAEAVNDLKLSSGEGGSTAAFDTDLRTRITNALQNGEAAGTITTISQAMDKLKLFGGRIGNAQASADEIANAIKTLTGITSSTSAAVQSLVSDSKLTGALATFKTSLTTEYVDAMNEVTGGTGNTFAGAITDVIATATSDGSGSTSSVDTALRNMFITYTHESAFPVTTIAQAIQKLMSNTTKDRANADFITELQSVFNTGLGTTSMANAKTALTTVATNANSAASLINTLNSNLVTETGQATVAGAVDWLATEAGKAGAASTAVTNLESQLKTATGQATTAGAVTKLWTEASKAGAIAGYSIKLDSNGYITGLEAINSGVDQSTFKVMADKFVVSDPNDSTPEPMFEVVGGAAYIKGKKIQQGTVTSVQYSFVTYASGTNFDTWTPNVQVNFPQPGPGSRAVITMNATAKQTGSDNDTFYFYCQRFDSNTGVWTDLPNQRAMFSFTDGTGMSQTWTFIDDNVPNTTGTISYKPRKQNVEGDGDLRHFSLTGLMCKK